MKVGIMQPYFFPYLGYISLIKHTDIFILFDPVQFIRHGWIERNRILKQNEGWIYIHVPLIKHDRNTLIKNILIDNSKNWKLKILSQLQPYKKQSPYYNDVLRLVEELFTEDFKDIVSLNKRSLELTCNYLGIKQKTFIFSQMKLDINQPKAPDEWALNICKALNNVTEYWNPPGGQLFFDRGKYANANIELKFHKIHLTPYNQKRIIFESGLSILDIMMFNSIEDINLMLDNFELT